MYPFEGSEIVVRLSACVKIEFGLFVGFIAEEGCMGSKPKFDPDLKQVESLAAQGLTQAQICSCMGFSTTTLTKYKKIDTAFAAALKRGQHKGISEVTNALFKNAQDGNLGAQCFYLKNRDAENWKDRTVLQHGTDGDGVRMTVIETGVGECGPGFKTDD